jgi:SAM-dependent methyltransferase
MALTSTSNGADTTSELAERAARALEVRSGIILDVGCGAHKHPGSVGMDRQDIKDKDGEPLVDIVWNWDHIPWPIPDESCLTVLASHVVEHVNPADGHFLDWMDECWRILKPDRQLALSCPYGNSSWFVQDPTHVNPCNEKTWFYFDPAPGGLGSDATLWELYQPKPWKVEQNLFHSDGFMEVVLRKRSEDPDTWQ